MFLHGCQIWNALNFKIGLEIKKQTNTEDDNHLQISLPSSWLLTQLKKKGMAKTNSHLMVK